MSTTVLRQTITVPTRVKKNSIVSTEMLIGTKKNICRDGHSGNGKSKANLQDRYTTRVKEIIQETRNEGEEELSTWK